MSVEKQPVHFISGLGIDERAFVKIVLPEGYEARHVRWTDPEEDEPLSDYCRRLLAQIDLTQPVILAGLSFGGVVSIELSRLIPVEKLILISSIARSEELPGWYRWLIAARLHRVIPVAWIKRSTIFTWWIFGLRTRDERLLLKKIMRDMPSYFTIWAMERIVRWKNETKPAGLIRIHGTNDRVLYFRPQETDHPIEGGGHFMVYTDAEKVSEALKRALTASASAREAQ